MVNYSYNDSAYKVGGLRSDSLSLFMHHANIHADLNCIVFDNTKGILLAAT